jgi:sec-independent protein translocase protein TatA
MAAAQGGGANHGRVDMLNNIGLPGLLLIAVVVLVLFGRGKISSLMGEVGKGITSFKRGVSEGEDEQKQVTTIHDPDLPEHTDPGTHPRNDLKADKEQV